MGKDPAFLFYPNDYLGGTMGWTFEEKGAYIELLMMQFNRGHMTSHMVGQVVGQLWVKIQDKFVIDDNGLYYNERLEEEKKKRSLYTSSRKNNLEGKNQYSKTGHTTSHMEDRNRDRDESILFSNIYEQYPKKIGRKAAERHFNASVKTLRDEADIQKAIANYLKTDNVVKETQYIQNASTWFNNWRDWIDVKVKEKGDYLDNRM